MARKRKTRSFWMRNTSGKPDAVLTMAFIGFIVILVKYILSGMSIDASGSKYVFGTVDAASIAALLTPTLGAYVARRYTDKKLDNGNDVPVVDVKKIEQSKV